MTALACPSCFHIRKRLSANTLTGYSRSISSKWKILFFGNDGFSLKSLERVHKLYTEGVSIEKLEIVTNTANRHPNAVAKFATEKKLNLHSWPLTNPLKDAYHLGIVVSFGHLIPGKIIKTFPLGILNVHASLLPRWRGAAPIIHTLLHGEKKTGVSIMRIHPHHFDVGEIVKQKEIELNDEIFQPELHNMLADIGSRTLIDCIQTLPDCLKNALPQDNTLVSYAPKVKQELGKINWIENSSVQIYNLSRALLGVYPLLTKFNNFSIKLYKLKIVNEADSLRRPPGYFMYIKEKRVIRVWCKDGTSISFDSIGIPGKKVMSANDFKNGFVKGITDDKLYFTTLQ